MVNFILQLRLFYAIFCIICLIQCTEPKAKLSKGFCNDIIEDIVVNHLYNSFLYQNKDYQKLIDKYSKIDIWALNEDEKKQYNEDFEKERQKIVENFPNSGTPISYIEIDSNSIRNCKFYNNYIKKIPFKNEFNDIETSIIFRKLKTPLYYDISTFKSDYFIFRNPPKYNEDDEKIAFSEPIFNKTKSKGLIFCCSRWCSTCLFTKVFLFEKVHGVWKVIDEELISIS